MLEDTPVAADTTPDAAIGADPGEPAYLHDPGLEIYCEEFTVTSSDAIAAAHKANRVLRALPISLFKTIDLKTQSGIVGAIFSAELATSVGAIPNPIEKGHPDVVPASAAHATEAELRNYPQGLEVKTTLGGVPTGSDLHAGEARVDLLTGVVWQAHHREVRSLMGLIWDYVGGTKSEPRHPAITGIFYSDDLVEDDWGVISGTTGRNTKVTGMRTSGRAKMAAGAVAIVDVASYRETYAKCLGAEEFANLTAGPE